MPFGLCCWPLTRTLIASLPTPPPTVSGPPGAVTTVSPPASYVPFIPPVPCLLSVAPMTRVGSCSSAGPILAASAGPER